MTTSRDPITPDDISAAWQALPEYLRLLILRSPADLSYMINAEINDSAMANQVRQAKSNLSSPALPPNTDAEDRALLDKAKDIAELLQRAHKLGWTVIMSPDEYATVIAILENATLAKD